MLAQYLFGWCLFDDFKTELFEKIGGDVDGEDGQPEGNGVANDCQVGRTLLLLGAVVATATSDTNHGEIIAKVLTIRLKFNLF